MSRKVALLLLILIVIVGWLMIANTNITSLLDTGNSPVLFTYEGVDVSVALVFWLVLFVVSWLILSVIGFVIDPLLGYYIFRAGLYLLPYIYGLLTGSKSRSGSSSGNTNRVG